MDQSFHKKLNNFIKNIDSRILGNRIMLQTSSLFDKNAWNDWIHQQIEVLLNKKLCQFEISVLKESLDPMLDKFKISTEFKQHLLKQCETCAYFNVLVNVRETRIFEQDTEFFLLFKKRTESYINSLNNNEELSIAGKNFMGVINKELASTRGNKNEYARMIFDFMWSKLEIILITKPFQVIIYLIL
jgi:Fe-S cluster biosynthesis and repair protein YggX